MNLTEEKRLACENDLRQMELMDADETIEETVAGDYWTLLGQTRGHYYFTNKKIVFVGGFAERFSIPYAKIESVDKTNIRLFMPTGIKVKAMDDKKGKIKTYKLSVMKRKNWIEFISRKMGA